MRIEVVCSSREVFGSDRSALRLAAMLRRLGHEVWLALPRGRPERGLLRLAGETGVPVKAVPVAIASRRGASGIGGALAPRLTSEAELTIYNSAAVARRYGDRRPRLLVLREWLFPEWRRHRLLCGSHARRVDAVVAVSRPVAERWRATGPSTVPVEVCPNWLGSDWLKPGAAENRDGVLFLGRLNAWKGHDVLAAAWEHAFGAHGGPSLTFVGAEPRGSRFHRAGVALGRRCAARGWRLVEVTPHPRDHLVTAALVVVPSLRPEPFGNVIVEALASGARVLAFPGGGVADLAPRFPWAIETVPRSVDALAAALKRWAERGALPQSPEDHERSLSVLREHYTEDAVMPVWERMLDRLPRERQRATASVRSASA